MNRREFLQTTGSLTLSAALVPSLAAASAATSSHAKLPRWRGFNLLEKFTKRRDGNPPFAQRDFEMIADLGFNFVRLPMSYLCWTDASDWLQLSREDELKHIDQAIEWGRKHGIHVNLNFHRAPGYCVNPPKEPLDLWTDDKALEACCHHWAGFARRYKGLPNHEVSFDLLNEPPSIAEQTYVRIARQLIGAIRAEDDKRLIIADGLKWGRDPVHSLADTSVAQSTRGYDPMEISHYKANWVNGSDKWPEPTWPLKRKENDLVDKARLRRERIEPWKNLESSGVGVHVGEWGAFNKTPHLVALAWMRDQLELWQEAGWGWALWNFRGSFGILDSGRSDANYEDFHGHKLDRAMLKMIQQS
jgi:endoglucanase